MSGDAPNHLAKQEHASSWQGAGHTVRLARKRSSPRSTLIASLRSTLLALKSTFLTRPVESRLFMSVGIEQQVIEVAIKVAATEQFGVFTFTDQLILI